MEEKWVENPASADDLFQIVRGGDMMSVVGDGSVEHARRILDAIPEDADVEVYVQICLGSEPEMVDEMRTLTYSSCDGLYDVEEEDDIEEDSDEEYDEEDESPDDCEYNDDSEKEEHSEHEEPRHGLKTEKQSISMGSIIVGGIAVVTALFAVCEIILALFPS